VSAGGEGARHRTVHWDDPAPSAAVATRVAGLAFLEAIRDGSLPAPPICRLLGFGITEIEPGRVVFEAEPSESHYNPIGSVHGGVISTLLDAALSCAVHSTLPAGTAYTTAEIKVNFVRPVVVGSGRLRAEGRVIHAGSRLATADARLTDLAGKLYAHAVGTCLIFTPR
jgi:uncharacterized protein (TIGR00369 family)